MLWLRPVNAGVTCSRGRLKVKVSPLVEGTRGLGCDLSGISRAQGKGSVHSNRAINPILEGICGGSRSLRV